MLFKVNFSPSENELNSHELQFFLVNKSTRFLFEKSKHILVKFLWCDSQQIYRLYQKILYFLIKLQ